MISRRDSKKNYKKIALYIALGIFFVAVWSPFKKVSVPLLESTAFFSSRVYTYMASVGHRIYVYSASNEALYQANVLLNTLLIEEQAKYLELVVLQEKLQKYESLTSASSTTSLFAKRIGSVDTLVHNTFRINKGAGDDIRVGQFVTGPQNTVIGIIGEVNSNTSLVSLLWNGNEVAARTSKEGTVLTLKGVDDGVYLVEVPHEMNFEIGEVIMYDANSDFVVGIVKKIKDNERDRSKEVFIHIPFHPSMIDVVRIENSL